MRAAGALLIKLTAGLLLPLCLGLHPSEVPVDCPATRHASSSVEAELDALADCHFALMHCPDRDSLYERQWGAV